MSDLRRMVRTAVNNNRNGIDSTRKLISEMCIKPSTYYYKLSRRGFTQSELTRLFKILNFSDEEITEVFK